MPELLTGIEITGYRQFERFRMEGLRRVNLLVGKNNAGKTALLEAVQILTTRPALGAIQAILERRGEVERESRGRGERNGVQGSLRHLFPSHELPGPENPLSIFSGDERHYVRLLVDGIVLRNGQPTGSGGYRYERHRDISIQEEGGPTFDLPVSTTGVLSDSQPFLFDLTSDGFLPASGMDLQRMADHYNLSLERGTEGEVIDALRLLDPEVQDVTFLAGKDFSSGNAGEDILIGYKGRGRHPLGSAGEGMKRMLGLALALSNARGGTLLVDEIDTGLHYSVMGDLWRLVTKTAQRLDIQVFATTHSLDCVRGIVAMGQEDPSLFEEVAVHTIDARRERSVATAGERLDDAVQLEVELR